MTRTVDQLSDEELRAWLMLSGVSDTEARYLVSERDDPETWATIVHLVT